MHTRAAIWLLPLATLAGCALVYNYGDYTDRVGAGGASSSSNGTSSSSSSVGGAGGRASSSASSSGGVGGSASSSSGASSTSSAASTTSASSSSGAACTGTSVCVPAPPASWSGPIAFVTGTSSVLACPAGWPTVEPAAAGGASIQSSGACTACACTMMSPGTCPTSVQVSSYVQASCVGLAGATAIVGTSCAATPAPLTNGISFKGDPSAAIGGQCLVSTAMPNPPATFASYGQGCSGTIGGKCGSGGVCVAPATKLCVYQKGTHTCPAGYVTSFEVLFGGIQDLTCTACQCAAMPGLCAANVSLFAGPTCSGKATTLTLDGAPGCVPAAMGSASSAVVTDPGTPTGMSCASLGGGMPVGTATGTNPVTVCCH